MAFCTAATTRSALSDRYRNGYSGTNGTFNAHNSVVLLDTEDPGKIWFVGEGCEPTTPPSGGLIYHICGGGDCAATQPDVYRMNLADRQSRSSYSAEISYEDTNWGHEYFPRVSTDGQWLTYGASSGNPACHSHDTCDYEIHLHQLGASSTSRIRLTTDGGNDQWAHLYVGELWQGAGPSLALQPTSLSFNAVAGGADPAARSVEVRNTGGGTLETVQIGTTQTWLEVTRSGSGNGQSLSVQPRVADLTVGNHNATVEVSVVSADGSPKSLSVTIEVRDPPRHMMINCGDNAHDVTGWERDDGYVTGGSDWTNDSNVDTAGVVNAAPALVYKSVRNQSPHHYIFPVANGFYTLRLHFADAWQDRSMDYRAESQPILQNFDINTVTGTPNKALVMDFRVEVSDGDGLLLEAESDGDVFECGIEVIAGWDELADAGRATDVLANDRGVEAPDRTADRLSGQDLSSTGGDEVRPVNDGGALVDRGIAREAGGNGGEDLSPGLGDGCDCGATPAPVSELGAVWLAVVLRRRRKP